MSSETVSSHFSAGQDVDRNLREASHDAEAYLNRARKLRQRQAAAQVHEELARRALSRPITPADRLALLLTIVAVVGALLSLIVFFAAVFTT